MPPQCPTLFHTRRHLTTKMHNEYSAQAGEGMDGEGKERAEEKKKGRGQQHSHGYSHRQEGGKSVPGQLPAT